MKLIFLKICLLIAGILLLGIDIIQLDFENLTNGKYFGIISNLLLIIAMIISIRYSARKNSE
ncbi:hypothetical protein [Salinimicrobium sp. GXAS 041]|uniref:hypothetical protein n=1 Tax=Salinimicrobium sp. GXAS 041 TaxID=3400806 RepID=UPI003C74933D